MTRVVITGANRGLGRALVQQYVKRGAEVIGGCRNPAAADALADTGAEVQALDTGSSESIAAFAKEVGDRPIDVLINNAGIMRWARFPEVSEDDLERHLAVHVVGSFLTARAAWPHMVEQGYGRIVMTASAGMLGLPSNTSYATAKGGVVGLTRSLNTAGRKHGITVNVIAPAAMTRMAGPQSDDDMGMAPDLVAPMVAFLAHEDCPVSGEIYTAGAGRFARLFVASTPGWVQSNDRPTVEDVAEHWAAINDESGYFVPTDLMDWSAAFTAHRDS